MGIAPGIIWLLYFFIANRNEAKSFETVFRVFVWSAAFTIPAAILEHALDATLKKATLPESLFASFVLIAPIEEFFKLLAVWVGAYRRSDFRGPMDGLIYALTAALGFVAIENALYTLRLGPEILWSRLLYSTPAHLLFSAVWGYSLGVARFVPSGEIWIILRGFLVSVLFHGSYNLVVAMDPPKAKINLIPLLLVLAAVAVFLVRRLNRLSPYPYLGDALLIVCPSCEAYTPESSEKCERCGSNLTGLDPGAPRFCWKCRHRIAPTAKRCPRCYVRIRQFRAPDVPEESLKKSG